MEKEATEAPKENKPTEVKPSFYDEVEPTTPTEPSWTQANRLVKNTAEYEDFIGYVKQQGGYITDTFAARGGVGLSIQYMLPSGRRA